ncbi:sugar-phosphatase [Paucilactobacillus wasatchensis]|uniref:Promiscuous sugar phosphatase, haloacid dehalogenase-like phosphatase family n=1 Tax=Paucilactobacillus wasatchensis TaxID=1335616 RepID=A0A0D0Y7C6_9LACO|nr:sugar-phosphatase [Paucilactobacillus wasatchensis]KIS04163.1 Promiscuous sugar phosphatase, haloacid dehalogenase-like phosphatase family [Paucilactobacillus wasatchensis]
MAIKLIALDIDGTLLNEKDELTQETIDAVTQATQANIKVVLCTGRPLTGAHSYLKQLGLDAQDDSYVITFNGSLAQSTNGNVLIRHTLNFADYIDLEALSRKIGVHFHCETDQYIYTANKNLSPYTIGESYVVRLPVRYREVEEMTASMSISEGMMIDEPAIIDRIEQENLIPTAIKDRFQVVRSEPYFLEFMNRNASKGNALNELSKQLQLTPAEVMAVGDQGNDLTMIEYAGLGVAMGNAIPEIKASANEITLSNTENGVAAAIRKFALNL